MSDVPVGTPTLISLREAARRTGLSKATIGRKIKSGEISVREKGADGSFRIDASELLRFIDASRVTRATEPAETVGTGTGTAETATETPSIALLEADKAREIAEAKLALAEERLFDLKAMLEELRGDRDQWREQAQRLALPSPGRRWWRWRCAG